MDTITTNVLIAALMIVESGGNPIAVNVREDAVGILQIRPIFVEDVNRIIGTDFYTLEDRYNIGDSIGMARVYFRYYGRKYEERTGEEPKPEHLARMFNGGYYGLFTHPERTDEYWKKVQKVVESFMEVK